MSELADTLRQLGKEYGQAGGYIHLELADKADALEHEVDLVVRERDVCLEKLDQIRELADHFEQIGMMFKGVDENSRQAWLTAADHLKAVVGRKAGFDG